MPPVPRHARTAATSEFPDARINAWRSDLADSALEERVVAARYAVPVAWHVSAAMPAAMHLTPSADAVAVSEVLPGERFDVIDTADGWAWGFSAHDHYVGYIPVAALSPGFVPPTHRVSAAATFAFANADIKSPIRRELPLNTPVVAAMFNERFLRTAEGDFVHVRHVSSAATFASDPVTVAGTFLGTPYKWGGRTRAGVDCSGLVQAALYACGRDCPRDSDIQARALGEPASGDYQRGDIVFFPGHVGIMADPVHLLHANAFHMATVVEPLADVIARLHPQYDTPVTAVRRLQAQN